MPEVLLTREDCPPRVACASVESGYSYIGSLSTLQWSGCLKGTFEYTVEPNLDFNDAILAQRINRWVERACLKGWKRGECGVNYGSMERRIDRNMAFNYIGLGLVFILYSLMYGLIAGLVTVAISVPCLLYCPLGRKKLTLRFDVRSTPSRAIVVIADPRCKEAKEAVDALHQVVTDPSM